MVFIESGKTDTENAGKQEQPDTSYAVYIERERDSYGEKKILGHMSCFSYIKVNLVSFVTQFIITFSFMQYFTFDFDDLVTDLIT